MLADVRSTTLRGMRLLLIVAAAAGLLSVAGCGKSSNDTGTPTQQAGRAAQQFFVSFAQDDWAGACAKATKQYQQQLINQEGAGLGAPGRASSCEEALQYSAAKMNTQDRQKIAEVKVVQAVQVNPATVKVGLKALGQTLQFTVVREQGAWKINADPESNPSADNRASQGN